MDDRFDEPREVDDKTFEELLEEDEELMLMYSLLCNREEDID